MIVKNDLLGYKNLKIFQNNDDFCFSLDSVLLCNFVTINKRFKKIIDLGCGNAPIPLMLSTRTNANILGVEIKDESCELAIKSIKENGLSNHINILNMDINNLVGRDYLEQFDMAITNPPYFRVNDNSIINNDVKKSLARHEITINLEQLVKKASYLLKNNGYFLMVHRTERLIEIIELFKKYNIELKRLQFVYPKYNEYSNMILIEGIKNGKPGLKIEKPLFVHQKNGKYRREIIKIFNK